MADDDSQQIPSVGEPAKRADFSPPVPGDDWDRIVVPLLWVVGISTLVRTIAEHWLPEYAAFGVQFFTGGLVYFRFRIAQLRRHGFGKWIAFFFLMSIVAALLDLLLSSASSRVWSGVLKPWLDSLKG